MCKPIRRKWDYEHRTTRWEAQAKIGTQPYGTVYFDAKPVVGATCFVWTERHNGWVTIERIDAGRVFCSWR